MDLLCVATTILRPCPNEIPCPGSDSPVINYSSEAPDPPDFIGTGFFGDSNTPPIIPPPGGNGGTWTATACGLTFTSTISQADADLMALVAAYNCQKGVTGQTLSCCNEQQCCTIPGPNGDTTLCIPAGLFCAPTCAEANQEAGSVACYLAKKHLMALSALPTKWCAGVDFSSSIHATNAFGVTSVLLWTVVSGALPPGISIGTGFAGATIPVTGNPTTGGSYTFTVRATNDAGNYVQRVYTMCVIDVVPTPGGAGPTQLPDANIGQSYTNTLAIPACATGASFSIISGALPVGLSLNPTTGVISGIPTAHTPLGYLFTVRVAGTGFQCDNTFTMVTVTPVTLTVTAYYTLDSAQAVTGDLIDSVAGLHMFKQPGTASPNIPALISNGFERQDALNTAYTTGQVAALAYPDTGGWSMFGWFKINSEGPCNVGSELVMSVGNGSIFIDAGSTSNPGNVEISWTDANFQSVQTYVVATTGAWHFFHLFYDPVSQQVGISFDNTAATLTGVGVSFTPNATNVWDFFGPFVSTGISVTWDEIGLKFDRKLTSAEQTYLYHSGSGRTWPL